MVYVKKSFPETIFNNFTEKNLEIPTFAASIKISKNQRQNTSKQADTTSHKGHFKLVPSVPGQPENWSSDEESDDPSTLSSDGTSLLEETATPPLGDSSSSFFSKGIKETPSTVVTRLPARPLSPVPKFPLPLTLPPLTVLPLLVPAKLNASLAACDALPPLMLLELRLPLLITLLLKLLPLLLLLLTVLLLEVCSSSVCWQRKRER